MLIGKFYVALMEVKSSHDANTNIDNIDVTSDAKVIKNNKRSAQHQLRDHLEVIQKILDETEVVNGIQSYIMWPFLGSMTRDPKRMTIKRWKEDRNLHVFEDVLSDQHQFDVWFYGNILASEDISEKHFITLLNRQVYS